MVHSRNASVAKQALTEGGHSSDNAAASVKEGGCAVGEDDEEEIELRVREGQRPGRRQRRIMWREMCWWRRKQETNPGHMEQRDHEAAEV
jgi:hypothetical protein